MEPSRLVDMLLCEAAAARAAIAASYLRLWRGHGPVPSAPPPSPRPAPDAGSAGGERSAAHDG
jgi:hypothetical protein